MQEKVTAFIKSNQLLTKHTTVLLGVSGGPDSMALLQYFYLIQETWNLNLIVVSADHQLRGEEGKADLEYVENECQKRNIEFIGASLDVPTYKEIYQLGTQVAARELRYQFYAEQMQACRADYLALGHHGDDQIETMLMALVRTGSSSSFTGIPVKRSFHGGKIIRPLLCLTKTEIEEYCRVNSMTPARDPSNKKPTYTRNYYRKFVLPKLKEKNQNLHVTIQHLSESLSDDEHYMMQQAKSLFEKIVKLDETVKKATLNINEFKTYPTALQRRVYHLILNYLYEELPGKLSYSHEGNFFRLVMSEGNVKIDFPAHLKISKSYQELTFYFKSEQQGEVDFHYELQIPGESQLQNDSRITTSYTDKVGNEDQYTLVVPRESIKLPLHIRTRQPGDRMTWKGLKGSKKIKNVFIDDKIPINKRRIWPIITDHNGIIIWLVGLRKRQFNFTEDTDLFIKVDFKNRMDSEEGNNA